CLTKTTGSAEGVSALARPLARDDDSRLPDARGRPEQLSLRREGRSRIEIVSSEIVGREPVTTAVLKRRADTEFAVDHRTADAAADVARVGVGEWHRQRACPPGERCARAGHGEH